jgi:hypothetical protein
LTRRFDIPEMVEEESIQSTTTYNFARGDTNGKFGHGNVRLVRPPHVIAASVA